MSEKIECPKCGATCEFFYDYDKEYCYRCFGCERCRFCHMNLVGRLSNPLRGEDVDDRVKRGFMAMCAEHRLVEPPVQVRAGFIRFRVHSAVDDGGPTRPLKSKICWSPWYAIGLVDMITDYGPRIYRGWIDTVATDEEILAAIEKAGTR